MAGDMNYYLELLNGGKFSSTNSKSEKGTADNKAFTIRLYVIDDKGSGKLLMVAPYISEYTFTAAHQWESAGNTIAGAIARGKINAMNSLNEFMANWSAEVQNINKRFQIRQQYYEQILNAADSLKVFKGTNIDSGFDNIDVMLLSDYDLISSITQGDPNNPISERCPIKSYLKYLINNLVGDAAFGASGVGSKQSTKVDTYYESNETATGQLEYEASAVGVILPPNGITIAATKFQSLIPKSYFVVLGNQSIIKNLVPEQLQITPSKMLTTTGDYYYVRISIKFTNIRYQIKEDMLGWLGDNSTNVDISNAQRGDYASYANPKVEVSQEELNSVESNDTDYLGTTPDGETSDYSEQYNYMTNGF